MVKTHYGDEELLEVLASVDSRRGWDFSSMRASRAAVPWEYSSIVTSHLRPTYSVLDVGTGGGEQLADRARHFSRGLGVDPDPVMVETARANASAISNLSFVLDDARLRQVDERFDGGNVDHRGFVTNEHRYLVVARRE